jgi:Ran GTPase-activating protein (RanGAP) involved in mRNA processing and transport
LAEFLEQAEQLRYLNVSNNDLSTQELGALFTSVSKNALRFAEQLASLDISGNRLSPGDQTLGNALRCLRALKHLSLAGALTADKNGATALDAILAHLPPTLELLDVSRNAFTASLLPHLDAYLRRAGPTLHELNLSECRPLHPAIVLKAATMFHGNLQARDAQHTAELCDALAEAAPSITTRSLDLSGNPLGVVGVGRLCSGMYYCVALARDALLDSF